MAETDDYTFDDLDAFFTAAENHDAADLRKAAAHIARNDATGEVSGAPNPERHTATIGPAKAAGKNTTVRHGDPSPAVSDGPGAGGFLPDTGSYDDYDDEDEDLEGKYIALDPAAVVGMEGADTDDPFVLVPANIHAYVPWWGWLTIALGIVVLVTGIIVTPGITLNRLAARLGDSNQANAQYAMRKLVMNGDERTVRKLYDMAASPREGMAARLRAVDTMSLIERVPEVDRALLRLELSGGTHEQVREAAIAARKQREAAKTRGRR